MKDICPLCGELKDARSKTCKRHRIKSDEHKDKKRKEWVESNREKIREAHRKYTKNNLEKCRLRTLKHRKDNPEQYKINQKKFIESRLKWIHEYKHKRGCAFCRENDPRCLDFHHRESETKIMGIAYMMSRHKEKILKEIAKCDLLCSNCHRKITYRRYDNDC